MKKILTLISAAIMSLAASAGPEITWLTLVHNFGAFNEDDGRAVCEFRFVNTGDEPLTVLSARASCGCTQPSYPHESVAPGDTAAISVAYDPAGRPGRFRKTVTVDTNTPGGKSRLTVMGVVIGGAASVAGRYPVDKGALQLRNPEVIFGQVKRPHLKTVFAEAYNRTSDSLPMSVVAKPRYVDINFEPKVAAPGEQLSIICYLRSNEAGLYGLVEDSIVVAAGKERISIPMSAVVVEDFSRMTSADIAKAPVAQLEGDNLDFGTISREAGAVTRTLRLDNNGKSTLEVRRVYSSNPGVDVSVDRTSVKKGKSADIKVTVDPAAIPGKLINANITVITNDPITPTQTVRVLGVL